jgi:hypothetical protein
LRAALVASCLRGALPPVDLRAVCLVRAIAALEDLGMERLDLSLVWDGGFGWVFVAWARPGGSGGNFGG